MHPHPFPLQTFRTRLIIVLLLAFVETWISVPAACGDVVWIQGQHAPLYGKIIATSDSEIQIQVFKDGEFREIRSINVSRLVQFSINLDSDRLTQLTPLALNQYRDYAEELASQTTDPAAQQLARRLYLITAANASGELQRGSLLGLIGMAESDTQRKQLEMLLLLTAPNSPSNSRDSQSAPLAPTVSKDNQQMMLKLVRAIRQGNSKEALAALEIPANRTVFDSWSKTCSLGEFDRMAQRSQPNKIQMGKLLAIELEIVQAMAPFDSTQPPPRQSTWGYFATQAPIHSGVLPDFENVTSFSPRRSVYRNGEWVVGLELNK